MTTFNRIIAASSLVLSLFAVQQGSAFADSHHCDGSCKGKSECHCKECKCEKGKECNCEESCKAGSCAEHHK